MMSIEANNFQLALIPLTTLLGFVGQVAAQQTSISPSPPPGLQSGPQNCRRTTPTTEGPYFKPNVPYTNNTVCQVSEGGERLTLYGRILDLDSRCQQGVPSVIDIWQADAIGDYYSVLYEWGSKPVGKHIERKSRSFNCRAKIETDSQGNFFFTSTMPGRYLNGDYYRPAHVHFKVRPQAPGYEELITQFYFEGDKMIAPDITGCDFCHADDPTLYIRVGHLDDVKTYVGQFNIVLQKGAPGSEPLDMQLFGNYLRTRERNIDLPFGTGMQPQNLGIVQPMSLWKVPPLPDGPPGPPPQGGLPGQLGSGFAGQQGFGGQGGFQGGSGSFAGQPGFSGSSRPLSTAGTSGSFSGQPGFSGGQWGSSTSGQQAYQGEPFGRSPGQPGFPSPGQQGFPSPGQPGFPPQQQWQTHSGQSGSSWGSGGFSSSPGQPGFPSPGQPGYPSPGQPGFQQQQTPWQQQQQPFYSLPPQSFPQSFDTRPQLDFGPPIRSTGKK